MSTHTTGTRPASISPVRGVGIGVGAGVIGSVAMGLYAMVASLLKGTGFFTPLHHIASLLAGPADMMTSMMAAMQASQAFQIAVGAALLGLVIHMMVGAVYGAVFGVVVTRLNLTGAGLLTGFGVAYGALVFVVSSFIGLPLAAAVFGVDALGSGAMAGMNPIADMPGLAGWRTFVLEHLVFGLVTGLVVLAAVRRRA